MDRPRPDSKGTTADLGDGSMSKLTRAGNDRLRRQLTRLRTNDEIRLPGGLGDILVVLCGRQRIVPSPPWTWPTGGARSAVLHSRNSPSVGKLSTTCIPGGARAVIVSGQQRSMVRSRCFSETGTSRTLTGIAFVRATLSPQPPPLSRRTSGWDRPVVYARGGSAANPSVLIRACRSCRGS